jgi:hypothetical protein
MWWLDGGNIDQDQQLDFISKGVTNLKNYSTTMKNETELHVRLLDDIDTDVSRATDEKQQQLQTLRHHPHPLCDPHFPASRWQLESALLRAVEIHLVT